MFRFLHLADVHLDTTFLCRSAALRAKLRDALRTAFERAVDCAVEEDVHAVLIAGDLFDNERLSFATERFLVTQLRRLDEKAIPCFYVSGNHDPGGRSYRGGRIDWPGSFYFIGTRDAVPYTVEDQAGNPVGRIVGAGHVAPRESQNLARSFPAADGALPHVGLLHTFVTSVDDADGHDRYAPCSLEDLRRPGYKYWALGHVHRRQQVCDVTEAWYSGNVQGRNPRETGAKGGLLVTIDDSAPPRVDFRPFAPVQWIELHLDRLESIFTLHDLEKQAKARFEEERIEAADEWLVRLVLEGRCPLADDLKTDDGRLQLEELLAGSLGAIDVDVRLSRVARPVDVDKHRGEPHLLGAVLELLDDASTRDELLESVAPDVLAGPSEEGVGRVEYLRSLLADLDVEAAARLLREE